MRDQIAPPTINLVNVDPACDLDFVPNTARKMKITGALSNSFGFGGTNATLAFRTLP
jgi:3-oxoacyl-[acyl-carrier-protein] synthase II